MFMLRYKYLDIGKFRFFFLKCIDNLLIMYDVWIVCGYLMGGIF